jgi:hypothetical protein
MLFLSCGYQAFFQDQDPCQEVQPLGCLESRDLPLLQAAEIAYQMSVSLTQNVRKGDAKLLESGNPCQELTPPPRFRVPSVSRTGAADEC